MQEKKYRRTVCSLRDCPSLCFASPLFPCWKHSELNNTDWCSVPWSSMLWTSSFKYQKLAKNCPFIRSLASRCWGKNLYKDQTMMRDNNNTQSQPTHTPEIWMLPGDTDRLENVGFSGPFVTAATGSAPTVPNFATISERNVKIVKMWLVIPAAIGRKTNGGGYVWEREKIFENFFVKVRYEWWNNRFVAVLFYNHKKIIINAVTCRNSI